VAFKDLSKGNKNILSSTGSSGDLLLQSTAGISLYPDSDQTTGDRIVWLRDGGKLVFEGTYPDAYEAKLQATILTADRELVLPDKSGIIALTSDVDAAVDALVQYTDSSISSLESSLTSSLQSYTDSSISSLESSLTSSLQSYTDELQNALNSKSDTSHTHTHADITDFNDSVADVFGTTIIKGTNTGISIVCTNSTRS
jgi:hypothetical protein